MRECRALDRASRVKHACSTFRVTSMDSDFPPHFPSIFRLVSFSFRRAGSMHSGNAANASTAGEKDRLHERETHTHTLHERHTHTHTHHTCRLCGYCFSL